MDWLELNESRKTMKIKSMMIDVSDTFVISISDR